MTQTNVDFSQNPSGSDLMDNFLAKQQENNLTMHSGSERPAYALEGTKWLDKSTTPWSLKIFDGNDDIIVGYINDITNEFILSTPLTTTGDILVQGVDKPTNLSPGLAGNLLMSTGVDSIPQWVDMSETFADLNARLESKAELNLSNINNDGRAKILDITSATPNYINILANTPEGYTVANYGDFQVSFTLAGASAIAPLTVSLSNATTGQLVQDKLGVNGSSSKILTGVRKGDIVKLSLSLGGGNVISNLVQRYYPKGL